MNLMVNRIGGCLLVISAIAFGVTLGIELEAGHEGLLLGSRSTQGTKEKFCVSPVDSVQPDCNVSFREDYSWTAKFNGTCIRPNVFLIPYSRPTGKPASTAYDDPRWSFSSNQNFLPPYVRFSCKAAYHIDFDFDGIGGLEFFRVWKSVTYKNGTDQMESQLLNVELLITPEATGRYRFHSNEIPILDTSFFIFAEGPPEGPYLLSPGDGNSVIGRVGEDGRCIIPCVSSNLNVTVELFTLSQNKWFLRKGDSNEASLGYTPEEGFHLQPSSLDLSGGTKMTFQCRIGEISKGDIVNVTLSTARGEATSADEQVLNILVKEGEGGICTGPESEGPLKFYNVLVRNPTESHLLANCLVKGLRNCGGHSYHQKLNGIPEEGPICTANHTIGACSFIAAARLHKEGLLVCIGSQTSVTLEYVTGFDGKIYSEAKLAPASALLKVDITEVGKVSTAVPNATLLVTGSKYELKCTCVELLFVKESQLLFVKYRNGTWDLIAELVWWKSGKEVYLNSDMIQLECRDRLWRTNEFYNSSAVIKVSERACDADNFRCASGQCIKENWRCDGDKDCMDASDEENCHVHVCKPGYFKCLTGECISIERKCNNKGDCPDFSDESKETCSSVSCSWEEFKCQSGQCVLAHFLCDSDSDCFDGSDESTTNCGKYFPSISAVNQNVTFVEGRSGELICDTIPLPSKLKPRIEWWRHDLNITDPSRLWKNVDGSKLSLRFPNVSMIHEGIYDCFAQNMLARSSLKFHVTVLTTEQSNDFPCHEDMSEADCIKEVCASRPNLGFCLLKIEMKEIEPMAESTGFSVWVTVVGIFLLVTLGVVLAVITWKYYLRRSFGVPSDAVRLRHDQDEVVILSRSGYD